MPGTGQSALSGGGGGRAVGSVPGKKREREREREREAKIVGIETELFFIPGADAPHVYERAWTLFRSHNLISRLPKPFGGR